MSEFKEFKTKDKKVKEAKDKDCLKMIDNFKKYGVNFLEKEKLYIDKN